MKAVVLAVVCFAFVVVTADVGPRYWDLGDTNIQEIYRRNSDFEIRDSKNRLKSFSWKSCEKKSTFVITKLDFKPDPIKLPGTITVSASFNNTVKIVSPVKAAVQIKKKVLGTWVEIPCIDQFGSCSYDDFCQILNIISYCPDPLTEHHIPCYCPYDVGTYFLPYTDFEVDVTLPIPSGDYFAMFNATDNAKFSGCFEIYFSMIE